MHVLSQDLDFQRHMLLEFLLVQWVVVRGSFVGIGGIVDQFPSLFILPFHNNECIYVNLHSSYSGKVKFNINTLKIETCLAYKELWQGYILVKNWMYFFVVLLACKSVDRSTFCMKRSKNVPRSTLLHACRTTKNAFNSYNYI